MTGKVTADISMSLDGFITGPNAGPGNGLGDGGDRLHEWIYGLASWREQHGMSGGEQSRDSDIMQEALGRAGAVIMGMRMFVSGEEPWGDEPPFRVPVFVVTHEPRETLAKKGGTTFTFVTDGIQSALEQAREAAAGKDVSVAGGANVIQQLINAGSLDEIQVHLVPILLGDGVRLFDGMDRHTSLETTRVINSPTVTHLKFRVVNRKKDTGGALPRREEA